MPSAIWRACAAMALLATAAIASHLPLSFEAGSAKTAPFFARGEHFTAYFEFSRVTVSTPRGAYAVLFRGANRTIGLIAEESPSGEAESQLRYFGIYDGVDLIFRGRPNSLEHDFVVRAGANPCSIELEFEGVSVTVEPDGSLTLDRRGERLYRHRPYFYQEKAGARFEVPGRYVRSGPNRVRFAVGHYDRARELIIE